jgi:cytochrome P450
MTAICSASLEGGLLPSTRDNPLVPAWREDELDCPIPPEQEDAYFDESLDAWVLSRHSDILAAFRISSLCPISPTHKNPVEPPDDRIRLTMRAQTVAALSPACIREWRGQLAGEVDALVSSLPTERPVDLVLGYARPLCLSLAAMVTGIRREDAHGLDEQARRVSAASAEPYDPALRAQAKAANVELREWFPAGPETLRESGFVALSQTLPCILGNGWLALMQHPRQWRLLQQQPELMEQAIEELLRFTGLARTLTRTATADIDLNGTLIRKGDRVILRLIAGNHDPERFAAPHQVDVTRRGGGHFTMGTGPHACVAASLNRMAATVITGPLVQRFAPPASIGPVEWQGGSGFRSPRSLWVRLKHFS